MKAEANGTEQTGSGLSRYLSPLGAWALSFGCAVGWGAFVMPGTTFLPIAGPVGTAIGMGTGGIIMLLIGVNYHSLMNQYPDAGGTYTYTKEVFGYDHGFLSAWFLLLVYIAIAWANATALPLIFRNLPGSLFRFGHLYQVAGYDVYLGEVLLSQSAILLFGLACMYGGFLAALIQSLMAVVLLLGVIYAFAAAALKGDAGILRISPPFMPGKVPFLAAFNIAALSPWAFAGFESISNSAQEFRFSPRHSMKIMILAVSAGAFSYITLALLAISALPPEFPDWVGYIRGIGNLDGLAAMPTFYGIHTLMGKGGLVILVTAILAGIVTGLVGNYIGASRLIYSIARDGLLPDWFCRLNRRGTPKNAIFAMMLFSLPIPLFGRTAISWIVDVSTIGVTIAYAYTSAVAFRRARENRNTAVMITGILGFLVSLLFFLYFMVPNFWVVSAMSTESYLILVGWSTLGFIVFRYVFLQDTERRLGKSTIVWIILLFLIFFTSMLWVRQATRQTTQEVLKELNEYSRNELRNHGIRQTETEQADSEYYLEERMAVVDSSLTRNSVIQMTLIMLALFIMLNIYNSMMEREKKMEVAKAEAEQRSQAKSIFLSNMSHDLRTPMNAIIGYTILAKKLKEMPEEGMDFLNKIEASSSHLLALINDVLEMSRIESGRMELKPEPTDLRKTLDEVRDLFQTQMEEKHIRFLVTAENLKDPVVLCDENRLNRVFLNLISNAYKFTPEGGEIDVSVTQTGRSDTTGSYELRVKDNGIGMSPEFVSRVFDAYSRDHTADKIQGTGLGMAITKSIIESMEGTIEVLSEEKKGTEFILRVSFDLLEESPEHSSGRNDSLDSSGMDYTGMKLLLVEDIEINREIAAMILEEIGFTIDCVENGKLAVDKISSSRPGEYQAVLMDIQMPVMNGYEATQAIRSLSDPELASVPIVAMTANAFAEDIQAAENAGMNGHIAKPIDVDKVMQVLHKVLAAHDRMSE